MPGHPASHGLLPSLGEGMIQDDQIIVHQLSPPTSAVQQLCREHDVPAHAFYLTAWALVVRAFTETDSICLGYADWRAYCVETDGCALAVIHSNLPPGRQTAQVLEGFKDTEHENMHEAPHNTAVVLLSQGTEPSELSWLVKSQYSLVMAISYADLTNAPTGVLARPGACIGEIHLFSPLNAETVSGWNARTQNAPGASASLLEVIRGHAEHRPNHPAVHAWDGTLSYAELESAGTRWAIYLQRHGVEAGRIVPMMMEHSKWAVIGEIAILKAGGAFAPLDPAQPVLRLGEIVRQTKATIAISSPDLREKLQGLIERVLVMSDEKGESVPDAPGDNVTIRGGGNPAYVLFTSGSTGRPKGCVVGYAALSDVVNHTAALKIRPDSRVLQFASYTYGMSLIEIHCALAAGATICIPDENNRLNALGSVLSSMSVTWAILTPSTTLSITEAVGCLETLVVGGEALTVDHVHRLAGETELLQAFGLTEWAGICCVSQRITSGADLRAIGCSPTARLHLADPANCNRLAPVGAVAELLVEGPALADGYLGDPEQTAVAFPKTSTGGRLYRTGDLVQYAADGSLRYVCRKDSQVKIRGMRVEPAEVEYQIRLACLDVKHVVVEAAATKGSTGLLILVAFIFPAHAADSLCTIKQFVERALPDYMCPSVYIPVESIHLTISRKVDRAALRHRIQSSTRTELERYNLSSVSVMKPQTDTERLLHQLVADALRLDSLGFGMGENFTSIGGDSVTAMLLVNRLAMHGYKVTVAGILRAQSLLEISALVRAEPQRQLEPRATRTGPVEQSPSQARMWFLQTLHPKSTWLLLPSATRLRGPLRVDALETAFSALVERHETLRTTFEDRDESGVQVVAPFRPFRLEVVDMASRSDTDLMRELHQQQTRPMDLTKECWRVTLFRLSPDHHILFVVLHHIICDGWSFDIFMKTLEAYYDAARQGQSQLTGLAPLRIQYQDFSIWQRQNKQEEQLAYWVRQLDGSHPAEFLADRTRPAVLSGRANSQPVRIDAVLYNNLKGFARAHQVTPFAVLLAAFRATHYRLTGAEDATIGIPSASRTQAEMEDLIGYFGNVQCIRSKVRDGDISFMLLVRQFQSSITAAFENQDVQFDQIVSKLVKDRDLSRHPLVQVAFVLHSQARFGQLRLGGLKTEQLPLLPVSRLDLEFHLYPGTGEDLHGEILYSSDLFHAETISAVLLVFYSVLREGLRNPKTDIGILPLTDGCPVNKQQIASHGLSIIDLFDEHVHNQPSRVAVTDTHEQLTYSELHQATRMIAAWLKTRYPFPKKTPVGVYAPRSCEYIIAILGILTAGLAYVPLDVDAPTTRTGRILSSLPSCQLVLVASGLDFPAQGVRCAYIADSRSGWLQDVDVLEAYTPSPTSLAYIIFTSGTTGTPKGVMIEHRGVANVAKDPEIVTHTVEAPVSSHMLSPEFDASGLEIYATLLNGGTLVCIDKSIICDTPALEFMFREHGITRAVMTPAMLEHSMISSSSTLLRLLDILYVGGDKLDPSDIVKARHLSSGRLRIFNCYGPTENSVVSTRYCVPVDEEGVNGIPVGRAIANTGAYVVDGNLQLLPRGVLGELVVTGLGLARGYTNPDDDIGRFVELDLGDARAPVPVRAYRTGDICRYRPRDGQLEFFGRMDHQVKIRGHRVELAEVDNALLLCPAVCSAVTVMQQRQPAELVSFVTVNDDTAVGFHGQRKSDQVELWRDLFEGDDHYGDAEGLGRGCLEGNFQGWISMYDGKPMDQNEMREWLQDTTAAILRLRPSSVLEIGTGSGMVLFQIIDRIQKYVGLELSRKAVDFVAKAVACVPGAAAKVHLQCGSASDIAQLQDTGRPLDLAVVNSVAQYFPSLDYLRRTVRDLAHKGVKYIFFGDIRSFALYPEFQASKVLHLYAHTLTPVQFRQHMAEISRLEKELLVDPAFFTALPAEMLGVVQHVEIWPKAMEATNELSCYWYAAVLHINAPSLVQMARDGSALGVGNIPFEKTIVDREIVQLLQELPADSSSVSWSAALAPVHLIDMANETGWDVEISWARQRSQRGGLDAIFHRHGPRVLFRFPVDPCPGVCSNDPLSAEGNRRAEEQALECVRSNIPAYMVPRVVCVLDEMPLNTSGKVDRQALAQRADIIAAKTTSVPRVKPPSAFAHEVDRAVWEEFTGVLGREIGVTDSFFRHGGHSLLAIKLVSRLNHRLSSTLSVSGIFQHPTVSDLAQHIRGLGVRDRPAIPVYAPFTLLDEPYDACHLHLPPGADVLDVSPVTDCQAWYLQDWSLVSHSYIIHGEIDADRLRDACQAAVRHHPALRTVFTQYRGQQVQVIRAAGLDGEPLALACLSATHHRLTLQLSHAQFDGISLSRILSDIARAYKDPTSPLSHTTPFSHYMHLARSSRADTLAFWKTYLQGAVLTALPVPRANKTHATNSPPYIIQQEALATLHPPSSSSSHIPFPTLVNAAIALTLARLVQSADVTFACVMSSRALLTLADSAESVAGPCVNRCLLRIKVPQDPDPSSNTLAVDLCRILQDTQARISAHAHNGNADAAVGVSIRRVPFVTHLPVDPAETCSLDLGAQARVSYEAPEVAINPGRQIVACIQVLVSSLVMGAGDALDLARGIMDVVLELSLALTLEGKTWDTTLDS
ncbi:hypothetical protein BJX99DRAFT_267793 [Aspergillus californicus]